MKKENAITIISLVITIIILIILAGISINLTLGENGILTKAKQAKENMELAQVEEQEYLNELYSKLETEGGTSGDISYDAIAKLAEFKKAIADYIDEAGGIKPEYTAETITFGESIKGIVKEVTKNATATASDINEGKTAWVNGSLITGTKTQNKEKLYLYHEGDECTSITGGWVATTKYENYMLSKNMNGAYTVNTLNVDFSKYSDFCVELSSTGTAMGLVRLHTTKSASTQDDWFTDARVTAGNYNSGYMDFANNTGITCIYKCSLNNLELNKKYYVTSYGQTSYASGMKIHNVWLE